MILKIEQQGKYLIITLFSFIFFSSPYPSFLFFTFSLALVLCNIPSLFFSSTRHFYTDFHDKWPLDTEWLYICFMTFLGTWSDSGLCCRVTMLFHTNSLYDLSEQEALRKNSMNVFLSINVFLIFVQSFWIKFGVVISCTEKENKACEHKSSFSYNIECFICWWS